MHGVIAGIVLAGSAVLALLGLLLWRLSRRTSTAAITGSTAVGAATAGMLLPGSDRDTPPLPAAGPTSPRGARVESGHLAVPALVKEQVGFGVGAAWFGVKKRAGRVWGECR